MNENSAAVRFFYGTRFGRFLLKKILASRVDRLCVKFLCSRTSRFLVKGYAKRHGIPLGTGAKYATFRDFFVRPKPGIGPIDLTPGHLASPCDGWLSVYPIGPGRTFRIKGSDYHLSDFLNEQIISDTYYAGGLCLVFRLCASDYHHYCYIDDGYQGVNHYIPGELHSVQPLACETYPVYTLNRRVWTLLTTEHFGPVIQTAIGALIVGGIVNDRENCRVRRGAEMGHFELAGSTIVLLFQKDRLALAPHIKGQTAGGRELRVEQGMFLGKAEKEAAMRFHFRLSAIPAYARLPLILAVIWNQTVYYGAKLLAGGWPHHDFTTAFDRATPFLPWTVSIYLASCIFWIFCYVYCASQEKQQAYRFLCADFLAKAACLVFFLLLPTTNVRPAVEGGSLWSVLMRILYQMDSPTNLFPSIHCLVSWLCFLGVRDAPHAPKRIQYGTLCIAAAIFLSTLTTKQHVVADVLGGMLLAQISYWASNQPLVLSCYSKLADCLSRRRLC